MALPPKAVAATANGSIPNRAHHRASWLVWCTPVIHSAERHGEFVANFEPEAARLRKAQMMGVGGLPAPY